MTKNWITAVIEVASLERGLRVYVERWQLFTLDAQSERGEPPYAILFYVDAETPFRLELAQGQDHVDAKGRPRLAAKNLRLALPKARFWEWAACASIPEEDLEVSPWLSQAELRDPFGHVMVVYTTEPRPPSA